jgi:hypothetical protein
MSRAPAGGENAAMGVTAMITPSSISTAWSRNTSLRSIGTTWALMMA